MECYRKVFGWTLQDYRNSYCAYNDGRLDGGFYRPPSSEICTLTMEQHAFLTACML